MGRPGAGRTAASLCKVLAGAWRRSPPTLERPSEELFRLVPVLAGSGLAPLVWHRLRRHHARAAGATELRRAYRYHSLQSALSEHKIREAFTLLRAAGVEPLLIKGLSGARFYARRELRPYGDIDLVVKPSEMSAAQSALGETDGLRNWVDLHSFDGPEGYYLADVYGRSGLFTLGGVPVRVPRPEDHLRVTCVHLLKHGAWRPLWLCDVAAAVEARPKGFDWGVCLGGSRRVAECVGCAVRLAHVLLGADLSHTPFADARGIPPRWLVRAVLSQWERPFAQDHEAPELMSAALRRPAKLAKALRRRWPDPVKATLRFGGSFDESPRLAYQLGDYVLSGAAFVARLPGLLRRFRMK
jgi:hypothetical protein